MMRAMKRRISRIVTSTGIADWHIQGARDQSLKLPIEQAELADSSITQFVVVPVLELFYCDVGTRFRQDHEKAWRHGLLQRHNLGCADAQASRWQLFIEITAASCHVNGVLSDFDYLIDIVTARIHAETPREYRHVCKTEVERTVSFPLVEIHSQKHNMPR